MSRQPLRQPRADPPILRNSDMDSSSASLSVSRHSQGNNCQESLLRQLAQDAKIKLLHKQMEQMKQRLKLQQQRMFISGNFHWYKLGPVDNGKVSK